MIRVVADHVLLAPVDPAVTPGGILIPAAHMDDLANRERFIRDSNQFAKARVVTVHEGMKFATHEPAADLEGCFCERCGDYVDDNESPCRVPPDIEAGQWVIYRRAEAAPVDLRDPDTGDELVIVHENSCLLVVEADTVLERMTNRDKDGA